MAAALHAHNVSADIYLFLPLRVGHMGLWRTPIQPKRGHSAPRMAPRTPRPRVRNASYHICVWISVASEPRRPLCVSVMSGDSAPSHVFCCVVCARRRVCAARESRAAHGPEGCASPGDCAEFTRVRDDLFSFYFSPSSADEKVCTLALCLQHAAGL